MLRTAALTLTVAGTASVSLSLAAPASNSAYQTDAQQTYVQDQTSAGIATVNMITCIMGAVRADALVNQGSYVALVDQNICSNQASNATSGAAAAASQAPSLQPALVRSSRTSDASPERAELWIDGSNADGANRIWVNLSVTAAAGGTSPYGAFRLDYCQTLAGDTACQDQGYLEGSASSLNFYQSGTRNGTRFTRALTLGVATSTSGSGVMSLDQSGTTASYQFAYDANLFRRSDGSTDSCFSRDASDPQTGVSAWSYGLYDATTGARIELNGGMPITFAVNGTSYVGYVGYWGLSLPAAAAGLVTSGMPVQGVRYASAGAPATVDYALQLAPGRLVKYSRRQATLRDLDQVRFDVWVGDASTLYAGAPNNTYYEAYWDDTTATFYVTGVVACGAGGCQTAVLPLPQAVSPAFWIRLGGVQAWSRSFGGDLYIDLTGAAVPLASAQVPVVYRAASTVYPGAFPATLYCLSNCPTAASLSAYFAPGSSDTSPYGASFNNFAATASAGVTTYSASAGVLADPTGSVIAVTNPASARPDYAAGVATGRLFTTLSDALCDPAVPGQYCDYRVSALPDYYVWQTGPQPWNQFAGLRAADGSFVQFDAPLPVTFTAPNSSTYGAYAGTSVVLQYGGFGQLYGFPNACIDERTNLSVACSVAGARVVPAFTIPFDATTGIVRSGTTTYLAKWLSREIRLAPKDGSVCVAANLQLPGNLTLPDATGLANPADPNSQVYIGAEPTVTAAPRVIQGVVEY